tara:strand:- start:5251 stop:5445 length:195 start_codon:yes stop_codon:yes gene_type:complete
LVVVLIYLTANERKREREREKEKEKLIFFRTPEENFCEKNEEEVRRKFQKISLEKQKKKKKKKK